MIPNNNIPAITAVTNAASMIYTPTDPPGTGWFWVNSVVSTGTPPVPNYYAPYITTDTTLTPGYDGFGPVFPANTPVVYTGDPGVRNPFLSQGFASSDPNIYLINGVSTPPYPVWTPGSTVPNIVPAGVPLPVNIAFEWTPTGMTAPTLTMDGVVMPPAIPPARLFQAPDAFGAGQMQADKNNPLGYVGIPDPTGNDSPNLPPAVSNATDSGDPWINNLVANQGANYWLANDLANLPNIPPMYTLSNGFPSLATSVPPATPPSKLTLTGGTFYYGASTTPPILPPTGVLPPTAIVNASGAGYPPYVQWYNANTPPASLALSSGTNSPYLGSGSSGGSNTDDRQHPYWRSELIQKAMNLTTVRTHQYAVWITIGFFEIKKQGDIGMLGQGVPQLAFDIMGSEVGAANGNNVRYRGFFIVDRLKLTGFNFNTAGAFRTAILYRKIIQ